MGCLVATQYLDWLYTGNLSESAILTVVWAIHFIMIHLWVGVCNCSEGYGCAVPSMESKLGLCNNKDS